jgi:hypothetical protein
VKYTDPLETEFIAFEFVSATKKLNWYKSSYVSLNDVSEKPASHHMADGVMKFP